MSAQLGEPGALNADSAWDEARELTKAALRARLIHGGATGRILEVLLLNGQTDRTVIHLPIAVSMSTSSIAAASYCRSDSTVKRAIAGMVAAGLVSVALPGGGRTIATYWVDVTRLRRILEDNP